MMQFSEQFPDFEIVSRTATQLSWSHFVEILPLKSQEAKLYYLEEAAREHLGRDEFRKFIARKAFERKEIADAQITAASPIPAGAFRDPYLFDILGLKDEYLKPTWKPRLYANWRILSLNSARALLLLSVKSE
jgi:hypothetical protein